MAKSKFVGTLQQKTDNTVTIDGVKLDCAEKVRPYLGRYEIGKKVYIELDAKNVTYMDHGDQKKYEGIGSLSSYLGSERSDASTTTSSKVGLKERSIIWEHHMTTSVEVIKLLVANGVLDYSGKSIEDMVHDVVAATEIFYQCTMLKIDDGDPLSRWKA